MSLSSNKNNMLKVLHYNNIYFFIYAHPRYKKMFVYKHTQALEYVQK